jgi:hypothetical protein
MGNLRPYWFKPGCEVVKFVKDIDEPITDGNEGEINPSWFSGRFQGACLFSRLEIDRSLWVKVWLYHSSLATEFMVAETRDEYAFWVDPSQLVELPL